MTFHFWWHFSLWHFSSRHFSLRHFSLWHFSFSDISVLLTFQYWLHFSLWHFSFVDILILVTFLGWRFVNTSGLPKFYYCKKNCTFPKLHFAKIYVLWHFSVIFHLSWHFSLWHFSFNDISFLVTFQFVTLQFKTFQFVTFQFVTFQFVTFQLKCNFSLGDISVLVTFQFVTFQFSLHLNFGDISVFITSQFWWRFSLWPFSLRWDDFSILKGLSNLVSAQRCNWLTDWLNNYLN